MYTIDLAQKGKITRYCKTTGAPLNTRIGTYGEFLELRSEEGSVQYQWEYGWDATNLDKQATPEIPHA